MVDRRFRLCVFVSGVMLALSHSWRSQECKRGLGPSLRTGLHLLSLATAAILCASAGATENGTMREPCDEPQGAQGAFYEKKAYVPVPVPQLANTKDLLPSPILDGKPIWIEAYWKAWELAFRNFHAPEPHSGFVSQYVDAAR